MIWQALAVGFWFTVLFYSKGTQKYEREGFWIALVLAPVFTYFGWFF